MENNPDLSAFHNGKSVLKSVNNSNIFGQVSRLVWILYIQLGLDIDTDVFGYVSRAAALFFTVRKKSKLTLCVTQYIFHI